MKGSQRSKRSRDTASAGEGGTRKISRNEVTLKKPTSPLSHTRGVASATPPSPDKNFATGEARATKHTHSTLFAAVEGPAKKVATSSPAPSKPVPSSQENPSETNSEIEAITRRMLLLGCVDDDRTAGRRPSTPVLRRVNDPSQRFHAIAIQQQREKEREAAHRCSTPLPFMPKTT